MGNDWDSVVSMCKTRIVDAGLPERVNKFYFESGDEQLITRLKGIMKTTIQHPTQATTQSKSIDAVENSPNMLQMKYSGKKTPKERRRDAVKQKIDCDFVMSSSDSDGSEQELAQHPNKKKKVSDAHEAHTKMCEKAIETMNAVNAMLVRVEKSMEK